MNARKAILTSLRQLLEEKRLDQITVQDILDASEVSRRTFYRYYQDKYDVITSYYLDNITAQQKELTADSIRQITKQTVLFAMENRAFFLRAMGHGDINSLDHTIFQCSLRYCELLPGRAMAELPDAERFRAEFFAHGCVGTFRTWILEKENPDAEELTDWILALVPWK